MSHGGGGDEEFSEPNLTPLLDLVMQLVMFFMICANFVMEQLNAKIQLPEATTARPIDREASKIIFFNIDENGVLYPLDVAGAKTKELNNDLEIAQYIKFIYDSYVQSRGKKAVEEMTVVIRGHKDTPYSAIYRVMRPAKDVGFANLQLRANIPKKGS